MKTYQELNEELSKLARGNEQLVKSLSKAREQIVQLRSDLESLADPPSSFGTFVAKVEDNQIDILHNGRKLRVLVAPDVDVEALTQGQEVRLNENLIAVEALTHETTGFVATAVEQLEDSRVLVQVHADEQRVMNVVPKLLDSRINRGDHLMVDPKSALVLEVLERKEVADLILEHIPDVSYSDIGGLGDQIDAIRDAIEMPFLHQELFHEYGLRPPKGVLLYGPPGCGKTMIAKAVAHELALKAARQRGQDPSEVVNRSWFLNVKGPEILNKYVGETERSIRLVFERAREKASSGNPVVV
ncbi:MAG: AAA family ATPase, partial [Dermabacter sp.]|nr:AAA family ATPase [Dermabacter sp.]